MGARKTSKCIGLSRPRRYVKKLSERGNLYPITKPTRKNIFTFLFGESLTKEEKEFMLFDRERRIEQHKRLMSLREKRHEKELASRKSIIAARISRGEISDLAFTRHHLAELATRHRYEGLTTEHQKKFDAIHHAAVLRTSKKHRGSVEAKQRKHKFSRSILQNEHVRSDKLWLKQLAVKKVVLGRRETVKEKALLQREHEKLFRLWSRQMSAKRNLLKKKQEEGAKRKQLEALVARRRDVAEVKKASHYERPKVRKVFEEIPFKHLFKDEPSKLREIKKEMQDQVFGTDTRRGSLKREHSKSYESWLKHLNSKRALIKKKEEEDMRKKVAEIRSKKRADSLRRKLLEEKQAGLIAKRFGYKEDYDAKFRYTKSRRKELKKKRLEKQKETKRDILAVFKKKPKKKKIEDIKTKDDIKDYIKV